jgi:hypothetical protein
VKSRVLAASCAQTDSGDTANIAANLKEALRIYGCLPDCFSCVKTVRKHRQMLQKQNENSQVCLNYTTFFPNPRWATIALSVFLLFNFNGLKIFVQNSSSFRNDPRFAQFLP